MLIAPSAYHRLTFHYQHKRQLVFLANRFAIAGLAFLALAMTGAIILITEVLFGTVTTAVTGAWRFSIFLVFWLRCRCGGASGTGAELPTVDLPADP